MTGNPSIQPDELNGRQAQADQCSSTCRNRTTTQLSSLTAIELAIIQDKNKSGAAKQSTKTDSSNADRTFEMPSGPQPGRNLVINPMLPHARRGRAAAARHCGTPDQLFLTANLASSCLVDF